MARIVKHSLGQEATGRLRQMVLNGRFTEGERLVEERIASELGISRTPLREALHRLAQEGILEKRRAGGYALRRLDPREVEDAFDIRSLLEGHAAALAASRAEDAQLTALAENLNTFRAANVKGDIPALVASNTQFHTLLREAAHAPVLAQLLLELDGVVERMLRPVISPQEAEWSDTDHLRILEHIRARGPEQAAAAMRQHVCHGKELILQKLRERSQQAASGNTLS